MKNLLIWLASFFEVDVVWVEKGHGHWAKRRRYNPVTKAIVLVCVLFFLWVSWGRLFPRESKMQEAETKMPGGVLLQPPKEVLLQPPEAEIPQFKMTDFPDLDQSINVYPGPVPNGLEVADNEYWLRVSKSGYKLYLYRGLDVEKAYEVAIGKNPGDKERAGDNRTPVGTFTVQSIEDSRSWTYDFRDGNGPIRGAYGPWFIRLRTGWRGIGIHGTHDPESLGTMVSEGCVRMHNSELEELKQFASAKMKVVIEE